MIRKHMFFLVLTFFFSSLPLAAVQSKIEGIVTDADGTPLEKVRVTIASLDVPSRNFELSTNKSGKFVQIGLWPGYYQVSFNKKGYLSVTYEVRVSIQESSKLTVKMEKAE